MKEVKAYIHEYMLDHVIDALNTIPKLPGIAVVHLREYGQAGTDAGLVHSPMVKLELALEDTRVEPVVDAIVAHARTGEGHPGDGKVFVSDIGRAVRIADGARDDAAIRP